MKNPKNNRKAARDRTDTVRTSVSLPENIYRALELLAKQNKVSLAWVVRDAAEKYVADKKPASGKAS